MNEGKNESKKIYVLQLIGEIPSTSTSHIIEIGGVSTDRNALEKLKVVKENELREYFKDRLNSDDMDDLDPEVDREAEARNREEMIHRLRSMGLKLDGFDEPWCYHSTDYTDIPCWIIEEMIPVS